MLIDPSDQSQVVWSEVLDLLRGLIPPILQLSIGLSVLGLGLSITIAIALMSTRRIRASRVTFVIGSTLSVFLGGQLATQNLVFALVLGLTTGLFSYLLRDRAIGGKKRDLPDSVVGVAVGVAGSVAGSVSGGVAVVVAVGVAAVIAVGVAVVAGSVAGSVAIVVAVGVASIAGGVAVVVAGGVAVVVAGVAGDVAGVVVVIAVGVAVVIAVGVAVVIAGGIAGGVAGGIAIISKFPLTLLILTGSWISICSSPLQRRWLGIFLPIVLTTLGIENLGSPALWIIPATLLCYFRIIPDYSISSLITLINSALSWISKSVPWLNKSSSLKVLQRLPPYSTELLWFPLPAHHQILSDAFLEDPDQAFQIAQKMLSMPLPGFHITVSRSLPQIIANLFSNITTTPALLQTISPDHPILSALIPSFSPSATPDPDEPPPVKTAKIALPADLAIMLPQLQAIVIDVGRSLEAGSIALRERGLERVLTNLMRLSTQLPGLGLRGTALSRWQQVIQNWQQVIQQEIRSQQQQSQGELLNPFLYGNPLRKESNYLFKGRQQFADQIVRQVLDRNRPTLVLLGPRRIGKSSFLYNLPRLLPTDLLPIYIDLQRAGMTSSESDFIYGLTRAIHRDSRSQAIALPTLPPRDQFRHNPYTVFEDWIEDNLPQLGDRRLLLCLDEFEKIGSALTQQRLTPRLLDELRHLIQHIDQLSFLFSGVQALDELGPNWSSYFISTTPIYMLYLDPREAEDLLRNPDPDFRLQYHPDVIPTILQLTRCQPYLLQLIGACLVSQANTNGEKIATPTTLQQAIPIALTQGEPYFANVWTEYTGTTPTECQAGQQFLLQLIHNGDPDPNLTPETQAAIKRMEKYHLLEHHPDGAHQIEIPLIEKWIHERAQVSF